MNDEAIQTVVSLHYTVMLFLSLDPDDVINENLGCLTEIPVENAHQALNCVTYIICLPSSLDKVFFFSFSLLLMSVFLPISPHTHICTRAHTVFPLSSSDPLCTAADVIYPQLGCGVFG